MASASLDVVTGASGYSGRHITRLLLDRGRRVVNLTGHPDRPNEFGEQVTSAPFNFDDPKELTHTLRGADTLYNTYWIRFAHGAMTFERAVSNSKALIKAAEDAGVRRIVHISITNPSLESQLPYFRGKAEVEQAIIGSRLSYAVLRPTVLFGDQGILINNIAWFLRRLPVFAIPGSGDYQLQPVFVGDLARLAVDAGQGNENVIADAVGPEVFSFEELVRLIAASVRARTALVHVPSHLALLMVDMMGLLVRDVVMTRDELKGLSANLLVSGHAPTCATRLSNWLVDNAGWLGKRYFSEIGKHYR